MSDLMIILLCVLSYMIGGISGMATILVLRQAKIIDAREKRARASAYWYQRATPG